jgi:hypothetical protein
LSNIIDNHVICYASSQSSAGEFQAAARRLQIEPTNSSFYKLNLVAGANFALGWIQKWHPRLNYSIMSLSLSPGHMTLRVHMDAMLQPARRIIARLLQEDVVFFHEHHYLNPLLVDDLD